MEKLMEYKIFRSARGARAPKKHKKCEICRKTISDIRITISSRFDRGLCMDCLVRGFIISEHKLVRFILPGLKSKIKTINHGRINLSPPKTETETKTNNNI